MPSPSNPSKPLQNRTILVACSIKKMVQLAGGLEMMGGKVLPFPVIEAKPIEDTQLLDKALDSLREYSWLIFTSAYGVSFFMKRLQERAISVNRGSAPKICAIGPATAAALEEFGWKADLTAQQFVAEGVIDALGKYHGGLQNLAGHRVMLPRAKEAREVLPETLVASGIAVDVVPCYQTVRAEIEDAVVKQLQDRNPDLIVFTSSSTIRNMMEILGPETGKKVLLGSTVAVMGPVTGKTAESFGKRAEIIPEANTVVDLLKAIGDYFSRQ